MDNATIQNEDQQYPGNTPEIKQELDAWACFLYDVFKRKKRDVTFPLRE